MRTQARALSAVMLALGVVLTTAIGATPTGRVAHADPARAALDAAIAEVEAYMNERMEATKTPGMAYAVVTPEAIVRMGAWGEDGDGQPISTDTPFLWGSVAKPVTATAVMMLVEGGEIDLDEPVRTYLPEFSLADDDAAERVTVRDLLQQTSGIPEGTGTTDRFDHRDDSYGHAIADLGDVAPRSAPGEEFEYASENYLVLGAVVEAVTDRPFAEYLRTHVVRPLQMSGAITTSDDAAERLADGHSYAFGQPVRVPAHYDPAGQSYGYLGGNVEDLAHFAMVHLNDGVYRSVQVLEPESVETMRTGAARVSDTIDYGLGWRVDTRNDDLGTSTVWHSGAVHGFQATLVLLPELELGIVVLQNIYGFFQDWPLVATGLHAARILAGGEPAPISADPAYAFTLSGLVAVLAVIIGAIGRPVYQVLRGRNPAGARRGLVIATACWTMGGLALAYLVGVALPDSFGASLRLIRLWAPDVGWLATGVVVGALALVVTHLTIGMLRYRWMSTDRTESAP
ncbi:beta-lactamase family protein [Phytoactinopolyspora halotolerans]|uniref:Beta-lactamase family protein n=1 Tax=Phytoactinopolyspora halotolerans TaxID=1981512 RepID=A0A6L9S2B9_9ACTN|nr:beta-lactamase family protein [Phytoactinopolyspora halotolerans]